MPVTIALRILSEACKGLDYAHRMKTDGRPLGIIHRDVSPSNILVSWEGDVKVADFGIAKAAHKEQKTATGTMKGKYGYMSPEQVKGEGIDSRSDIFAAGILLYECLVGRRLFKGETDLETLEQVREAAVPRPPSAVNNKVPPEVDELVAKALSLNPDDRFQTAGKMHEALADRLFNIPKRMDTKALGGFMQKLFTEEIKREDDRAQERKRILDATPKPASLGDTVPPLLLSPPTRPDLPMGQLTPSPARRSALSVGLVGLGTIIAVAALVVLGVWFGYQPAPPARTDAGSGPPPVAVKPRLGVLSIDSQPGGAQLLIDDEAQGKTTPARVGDLDRSRSYKVGLKLAGHKPWSKELEFGDMEKVAMQAQLIPLPKPPDPPPKDKRPQPVRPAYGTLNVNATGAWAYVYVDGKKQSRPTPLYGLRLRTGTHTIRLENPKLKLSAKRKVRIGKGKTVDLVIDLK